MFYPQQSHTRPAGVEPLDTTEVHPESYELAKKILKRAGAPGESPTDALVHDKALRSRLSNLDLIAASNELSVGRMQLQQVVGSLVRLVFVIYWLFICCL